jgi:hypothetical protein
MIVALRGMDPERLAPAHRGKERGGVGEAIAYVRREPTLLIPLAMMALVGTLAFNFQVLLPLLGRFTFDGGAAAYTALAVSMAVGSVIGALATGARGRVSERLLVAAAVGFGASALLAAAAPTLGLAMAALVPLGLSSVTFAAGVNSTLQLEASPAMRGRVMALYSVVFLGSTPIGGPIVGWLAEVAGPRAGLVLGGVAALAAAAGGAIAFARRRDPEWYLPLLSGLDRRWWGWLGARRAIAVQAGGADQLHGAQGRGGLDVEPDPVALLDRGDGVLATTPEQGHQDRVAGADHGDLGPQQPQHADQDRERADRPQALEHDPAGTHRRQAGRRASRGERRGHVVAGAGGGAEHESSRGGERPPGESDDQRCRVEIAVGDDDPDRPERRCDAGDQQDRHPKQVAEQHQRARKRSRNPSGPSTTRSARA